MASAKAKKPALEVPQSDEEADALLKAYGEEVNKLARIEANMSDAVAIVTAEYEAEAAPIKAAAALKVEQLTAFAAAHRNRLTDKGKTKTATLPAGIMGWRNKPPSVRFAKGLKVEGVVANIRAKLKEWRATRRKDELEWASTGARFLRLKIEVNKDAMLDDEEVAKKIDGVSVGSAGEEFYIAPNSAELAELRT